MTIKQIQHLLAYLGFYKEDVDGIWGVKSQEATIQFQRAYKSLAVDGIVGEKTEKTLRHAVCYGMPEMEEDPKESTQNAGWGDIQHFTREEFKCKCGQYHPPYCDGYPSEMDLRVVRLCDGARKHFGKAGHVVSGLRCPQHNVDSGGVANSQHMYGEAVDLRIDGVSADSLLDYFLKQPGVRYAYKINATNVHVDVPAGKR